MIKKIKKRNGKEIDFSQDKITRAIFLAASSVAKKLNKDVDYDEASRLSDLVVDYLEKHYSANVPNVEQVQDAVIRILIENGHVNTSQAYILYRNERRINRNRQSIILNKINEIRGNKYFDTLEAKFNEYGKIMNLQNNLDLIGEELEGKVLSNEIYIDDLSSLLEGVNYIEIFNLNDEEVAGTAIETLKKLAQDIISKSSNVSGYLVITNIDAFISQIMVQMYNETESNKIISYSQFLKTDSEIQENIKEQLIKYINLLSTPMINSNIVLISDNPILEPFDKVIPTKYELFLNQNIKRSINVNINKLMEITDIIDWIEKYLSILGEDDQSILVKVSTDNLEWIEQLKNQLENKDVHCKITNILSNDCYQKWLDLKMINAKSYTKDQIKITENLLILAED